MKNCFLCLRDHAPDVTTFEKKKIMPLTEKELKSYQNATKCYICRKTFT